MRAAVFYTPNKPLSIEDVNEPKIDSTDAIVAVKICGICHTDIAIMKGIYPPRKKPPLILGHEIAGEVVEIGPEVKRLRKGHRVTVQSSISCGRCYFCLSGRDNICNNVKIIGIDVNGGYAEYVSVPERNLFRLPEEISYREGAVISDALSTPYHAVRTAQVEMGESIVIYGVGGLGINAVQIAAKLRGAKVIAVDIDNHKLRLAKRFGAYQVINAKEEDPVEKVKELTKGLGADCVLEFVGLSTSYVQAVRSVRRGGRVIIVGASTESLSIDSFRLFKEEINITGSYVSLKSEIPTIIDLVSRGKLDVKEIITDTVALTEINRGIEIMEKKTGNPLRVAVEI